MTSFGRVADVYGRSLYLTDAADLESDAESLLNCIKDESFFYSKKVSSDAKLGVLASLGLKKSLHNFCALLVKNNRDRAIPLALGAYINICKKNQGELDVQVKSCVLLSPEDKKEILSIVSDVKSDIKKVNFINEIDKEILAGFVIRFNSVVIDCSLKSMLKRLRSSTISAFSSCFN